MASLGIMKQRVATAQAVLKASVLSRRNRDVRIMGFLETVEKTIAQKQRQISDLTKERDSALDEAQHLRNMLNNLLAKTETLQKHDQDMGMGEMGKLMDRLDKMAPTA